MQNSSKCRVVKPRISRYISNSAPAPKGQGSLWNRGQKDCKSQRNWEFLWDCVSMLEAIPLKSHQQTQQPTHDQRNKDDTNKCSQGGGKPRRPQSYTKLCRQFRSVDSRRNNLSQRRAHQCVIQYQMGQPWKHIHISNNELIWKLQLYIYVTTIKEKKAMDLKEGKEVCAWESLEGRRERINDVILCYQNF